MISSKRLGGALLVTVIGCVSIAGCNLLKKNVDAGADAAADVGAAVVVADDAAPAESDSGAAAASLPAECETYLTQFTCYLTKTKKDLKAADDMRASLTEAAKASQQSAIDMCNGQLTAKLNEFKAQGCAPATATAPVVTVKTDGGIKDASTDAKVADASASTATLGDGGKKPCTGAGQCPETDACESGACVTKCKNQVWVDTAKACGDVCSSSTLMAKKCPDGFTCKSHGRGGGVGGCIKN
jgi:hypothetical protein